MTDREQLETQRRILHADNPREQAIREMVKAGLDEAGVRRCMDALANATRGLPCTQE